MKYDAIIFTECNGSIGWGRDAGAYTVASRLREIGYKVKVLDFFSHFDAQRFQRAIDLYVSNDTKFLGFSSTHFSTLMPEDWKTHWSADSRTRKSVMWNVYFPFPPEEITEWFDYAKQKFPQLKIVVGGQKVAQKRALQKKYPMVDLWVGGMADKSVLGIMEQFPKSNTIKSELDYGSMTETEFKFSKIHWTDDDHIFPHEALPLEISRGCPFNCAFCDYPKKAVNSWTLDETHLRDVLIENYERFGTQHYMITDYQLNENIKKMSMIHRVFTDLPFKITWSGFGRLDLLYQKHEMISMIHESGCRSIQWGIETITDHVGPIIGKVTKRDIIEKALDMCKTEWKNDIIQGSGFILGLPGETKQTCIDLVDWISTQPWLDAWEITPLFIGSYDESKSYTIDFSKIQRNPKKYGYTVTLEKNANGIYVEDWQNGDMSKLDMINIIERAQQGNAWKKRIMTSYLGYSRASNLRFTHNEIRSADKNNHKWIQQHAIRYNELASEYLRKNDLKI
jgi:radical SAM superfamily enzyme YgiQ (UPF0313 family)